MPEIRTSELVAEVGYTHTVEIEVSMVCIEIGYIDNLSMVWVKIR